MGGDGQALLNKRKLLESLYQRDSSDAVDVGKLPALVNRLRYCALTHRPLSRQHTICCDLGGQLFDKEAVVMELLARKQGAAPAPGAAHITRLRDITELVLPPATSPPRGANVPFDLTCPVTNAVLSSGQPFVCNWYCGHVLARSALGENVDAAVCPIADCRDAEVAAASNAVHSVWVQLCLADEDAAVQRETLAKRLRVRRRAATEDSVS